MGTAFLDELWQFRSVDGNFGPHTSRRLEESLRFGAGEYEDIVALHERQLNVKGV